MQTHREKRFNRRRAMIERLTEMPEGTIGFRLSGEITRADHDEAKAWVAG